MTMALTRDFRETVQADARRDPAFRRGLLSEALESLLGDEVALGKELLRDYINATVGFPTLATQTKVHAKTLHQMFGAKGNPMGGARGEGAESETIDDYRGGALARL